MAVAGVAGAVGVVVVGVVDVVAVDVAAGGIVTDMGTATAQKAENAIRRRVKSFIGARHAFSDLPPLERLATSRQPVGEFLRNSHLLRKNLRKLAGWFLWSWEGPGISCCLVSVSEKLTYGVL